jgi:hypothetical protein
MKTMPVAVAPLTQEKALRCDLIEMGHVLGCAGLTQDEPGSWI